MSKPKQKQRFEKVVEWKKKPEWGIITSGSLIIIISILFPILPFVKGLFIMGSIIMILDSLGEGRKVYWRRVK